MYLPLLLVVVLVVSVGALALLIAARNPRLRTIPLAERLVCLFFTVALIYPVLRYELMSRFHLPSPVLGAWQDLAALVLVAVLLAGRRQPLPMTEKSVWGAAAILVCGAVNALVAPDWILSLYGARLTYLPMAFFVVGLMLPPSPGSTRRISWHMANLAGLSALLGLTLSYAFPAYWLDVIAFSSQDRGWGQDVFARAGGYRMTGTLIDPVSFGFLSAAGVIIYVCLSFQARRSARWGAALGATLCLTACGLSLSRGAWAMAAAGLTITAPFVVRDWARLAKAAVALILLAAVLWFAAPDRTTRQAEDLVMLTWEKTLLEGNSQREQMWDEAVEGFVRKPFGFGLGAVGHTAGRFPERLRPDTPMVTDGWYFKLMAEGGAPLLVSFVVFQALFVFSLWRRLRLEADPDRRLLLIVTGGLFLGASAMAAGCNLWDLYFTSHLMWFLTGLSMQGEARPARKPRARMAMLRPRPAF